MYYLIKSNKSQNRKPTTIQTSPASVQVTWGREIFRNLKMKHYFSTLFLILPLLNLCSGLKGLLTLNNCSYMKDSIYNAKDHFCESRSIIMAEKHV